MTERARGSGYATTTKMTNDLGPRKTLLILVIVVGCFAVLWPKVFYPMLAGSANQHIKPSPIDKTTGCCDVISEKDVSTIKIMSELCSTIIQKDGSEASPTTGREMLARCSNVILDTCGIDISAVLLEKVRLGHTTKQILDQVRSLNGSLCLKYNFGVAPWRLGVPHRIQAKVSPSFLRQERPIHLRSEMVHPAFRERGRAIPQAQTPPPAKPTPSKVMPGRPGPIPAMRPTMGGAGHMVAPSKQSTGSMGLIMPIYTIGIVIFFTYTVMKIVFKKQPESLYPDIQADPIFRKEVFESNRGHLSSRTAKDAASSKLVVNAVSALLEEVDQEIASRKKTQPEVTEQDVVANGTVPKHEDEQPSVKVLGMETRASCEGGKKWSRSGSPVLPTTHAVPKEPTTPPQEIYLEGSLPPQSHHLLVSDSATEAQKMNSEEDPAVVLAGKMTLSVISLDSSENGAEKLESVDKIQEDTSSSNVSDDYEKIDGEIDEQINNIIAQAQEMELDQNLLDEIKKELSEIGVEKKDTLIVDTAVDESDVGFTEEAAHIVTDENKKCVVQEEIKPEPQEKILHPVLDSNNTENLLVTDKNESNSEEEEVLIDEIQNKSLETDDNQTGSQVIQKQELTFLVSENEEPKRQIAEVIAVEQLGEDKESEHVTLNETEIYKTDRVLDDQDTIDSQMQLSSENTPSCVEETVQDVILESKNEELICSSRQPGGAVTNEEEHQEPISQLAGITSVVELNEDRETNQRDALKSDKTEVEQNNISDSLISQSSVKTSSAEQKAEVAVILEPTHEETGSSSGAGDFVKLNEAISDLASEFRPISSNASVSDYEAANVESEGDDEEEEVEYEYEESDNEDEEIVNLERLAEDGNSNGRLNGHRQEQPKNGTNGSSSAEDDLSDDENVMNEEIGEEEVEEIIEYITDEEEEDDADEIEITHRNNINHFNNNAI